MTQIAVEVSKSIDPFRVFLRSLPSGTKASAHKAYVEYVIGDERHGLKHEPDYNEVSRTRAYGQPFQTEKQWRWFFWALNTGLIHPGQNNRTHAQQQGWTFTGTPGTRLIIRNDAPGIQWTMGDEKQANQPRLVGWRKTSNVIKSNHSGGIQSAQRAADMWIKKNRK